MTKLTQLQEKYVSTSPYCMIQRADAVGRCLAPEVILRAAQSNGVGIGSSGMVMVLTHPTGWYIAAAAEEN